MKFVAYFLWTTMYSSVVSNRIARITDDLTVTVTVILLGVGQTPTQKKNKSIRVTTV